MSNILFLQFVTKNLFNDFYDIGNGFSDTYDFCKSKGDMVFLEHKGLQWARMGKLLTNSMEYDKFENLEPPIKKGTIYACAMVISHMYQLWVWAKNYPDVKFIVGGPGAFSMMYIQKEKMPLNMIIWDKSLEEYFGFEDFSYDWKINIPPFLSGKNISFAYTLEAKCYWGKCSYCNYAFCKQRKRKEINFGFEDIYHNALKIIRLHSPSLSPSLMYEVFPRLPERKNIRYDTYIRTGQQENKALRNLEPLTQKHNMNFVTGLEFPSDDMLLAINKGITMKDVYDTINIFVESKHNLRIFIILFMDNVTEKHVDLTQEFVDRIPPNNNINLSLTRLFIKPYTKFFKKYNGNGRHINIGPFYYGYMNNLSNEQIILNKRMKQILYTYPNVQDFCKGILSWDNDPRFKKYNVYRKDV